MQQLKDQRFLVLGGSSGIGLATARAAAGAGAAVTVASRSRDKLDAALAAIGGTARAVVLDTTDNGAVERFFADESPWDHVAISAAETARGPVRGLGLDAARAAMESKFWGAYQVARAARIGPGGSLTFVSGVHERAAPRPPRSCRGRINAALEGLARGLALELAPVRVNTVSPGLIETPLWSRMAEADRAAMFANAAERLPARRVGRPEDVANAVLFLAATPFATGSTLRLDGGAAIA